MLDPIKSISHHKAGGRGLHHIDYAFICSSKSSIDEIKVVKGRVLHVAILNTYVRTRQRHSRRIVVRTALGRRLDVRGNFNCETLRARQRTFVRIRRGRSGRVACEQAHRACVFIRRLATEAWVLQQNVPRARLSIFVHTFRESHKYASFLYCREGSVRPCVHLVV